MSIYDEANAGFAEVHDRGTLGEACNVGNVATTGVFGGERTEMRWEGASQRWVTTRQAVVTKENLPNRPADRAAVTKGTDSYVITGIGADACQWILSLEKRT